MVDTARRIAIAAELHDGAGVIDCNPERAALLRWIRAQALTSGASTELENRGMPAAETVECWDAASVRIIAGPHDARSSAILLAACSVRGIHAVIDVVERGSPELAGLDEDAIVRVDLGDPMACFEELRRRGGRCRLAPAERVERREVRRSPLPAGLPFDDPDWRAALLDHVAAHAPERFYSLLAQLGQHDLGANPIEDAYAGNGLRDRNRELLVNIVP